MQDMVGNGSSAVVTILLDEKEQHSFTIESDTTSENTYEIDLTDVRDLILRFDCHAVDEGFCGGIIINKKVEE